MSIIKQFCNICGKPLNMTGTFPMYRDHINYFHEVPVHTVGEMQEIRKDTIRNVMGTLCIQIGITVSCERGYPMETKGENAGNIRLCTECICTLIKNSDIELALKEIKPRTKTFKLERRVKEVPNVHPVQ